MATSTSGIRIFLQTVPAAAAHGTRARPLNLKPWFALSPPRGTDGRPLRCLRGSVLCTGDVSLLSSAAEDGQGGTPR